MAEDPSTDESPADRRLRLAYDRYVGLYDGGHRPGTVLAVRTAQARLDLSLCLAADGEELPELVASQLARDASVLLSTTQALPES
jgi:hypothetical protein